MARKPVRKVTDNHPLADIGDVVQITGPKKGRWRAGRYFTNAPVTIPVADLSEDEQISLAMDPALTIVPAAAEPAKPAAPAPGSVPQP